MSFPRTFVVLSSAATLLGACARGDKDDATRTPRGAEATAAVAAVADTGNPAGTTNAAGGAAAVTATDARSVTRATDYKLTEENFGAFVAASDSLYALRKRDREVAAFLDQDITDGANGTQVSGNNAGRTQLESNAAVSKAINGAGISIQDYFVAAISIAQAERFMGNPKAAPPTPTLGPNAAFLNAHKAQLDHLHSLRKR